MQIRNSVNPQSLLASLDPSSTGKLVIDLSDASFIEPAGLVGIAAIAERARRAARPVNVKTAKDKNVANYISRMNLGTALDGLDVSHDIGEVRARDLSSELLEVSRVSGQHAGEGVAELVYDKLRKANVDGGVCEAFHAAICEVVGNVEFHAAVENCFVAAQTTYGGNKVLFAIADSGQGLRGSLEESMPVNDDENALQLAVTANVSGTGETGRGQGLPDVIETATGLRGKVDVASGKAYSQFSHGNIQKRSQDAPFNGTLIQVELDCVPGA
ncbi:hypothetical protein [Paramicrobacterium chengjingii]|uniref:STAS domain-containing protein n=1 Tax=Paramicrobacterium chengjingii TaxID=2769067 RepID=A0ABX6YLJ2_9MICO|nr:hypothetical protein [Microbacterium chengjingii]QPZ39686.1 hypothetical protein HCR76_06475 [Microbacterium chengjingii]